MWGAQTCECLPVSLSSLELTDRLIRTAITLILGVGATSPHLSMASFPPAFCLGLKCKEQPERQ